MNTARATLLPVMALLVGAVATGCATTGGDPRKPGPVYGAGDSLHIKCTNTMTPEHRVELDAIDGMMETGENYAALARLEGLSFSTQQHWLRWAQLLAKVDKLASSERVFTAVADACASSQAYHGLGVVSVKTHKYQEALQALSAAKSLAPASADIRNDLGVVLMRTGSPGPAAFELRTAYELSGGRAGVGRNMVAAYYLEGGEESVQKLKRTLQLSDDDIRAGVQFATQFPGG